MKFEMTDNGFTTTTSFGTLTVSGDDAYGFRPYQLLVSSIAVCSGGVMRKILEKMRIPVENMEIEVKEVIRNEEMAHRIEKIHLHFVITSSSIDHAKMPRIVELTEKNCSMLQSVKNSIEIVKTYELQS